ncbi:pilus assembly protein TadG-related protein [Arthrobacter sp. Br18]|uniref:pilus assembly protein TadG-related protein n=1 Tax=Arthrobacter sp. Br18 TaxID=1312954 RepID=UPI0031B7FDEE
MRIGDDEGQVSVLIIGYLLISLLVLTVVMAISAVYIEHKKLLSVADGAALAAADSFSIVGGSGGPGMPLPSLSGPAVQASVGDYLDRVGAGGRFSGLSIDPGTGAPDGRTARVVLTAVVRPPVVSILVPAGIPITAVADARSELTR